MPELSTKPYLIRAIYDWCTDSGFTPYVAVAVDDSVRVPNEFVKNGEIVLNVSALATNRLKISNEAVEFQARFGGVARDVYVPLGRVIAIYARENGQGMAFDVPRAIMGTAEPSPSLEDAAGRSYEAGPRERVPLVPIAGTGAGSAAASAQSGTPPNETDPPPGPKPGDRPKLTRVK